MTSSQKQETERERMEREMGEKERKGKREMREKIILTLTVVCNGRISIVFGFEKVGKHLFPRPAKVTQFSPTIIVSTISPNVQHVIEDRGSAKDTSSWPSASSVDQTETRCFLRFSLICPVNGSHLQRCCS